MSFYVVGCKLYSKHGLIIFKLGSKNCILDGYKKHKTSIKISKIKSGWFERFTHLKGEFYSWQTHSG